MKWVFERAMGVVTGSYDAWVCSRELGTDDEEIWSNKEIDALINALWQELKMYNAFGDVWRLKR